VQEILEMDNINDKIHDRFKALDIIVGWYLDLMKFCKISFVLNNSNTLKNFVFSYKWRAPKLLDRLKCESEVKTTER
jgi:hypothetical protein